MKKSIAVLSLVVLTLACNMEPATKDFRTSQAASIETLETKTFEAQAVDPALVEKLTDAYIVYADSFPQDSMTPYYISKAGDLYKVKRQTALKAITTYNRVLTDYPRHPLESRSIFMMGFTFDEVLGDKERAAKAYTHFLEKFPDHPLAKDARALLSMAQDTGISDMELIEQWEQEEASKK
jgi:tetratricopeptide (TPR) repeat protein